MVGTVTNENLLRRSAMVQHSRLAAHSQGGQPSLGGRRVFSPGGLSLVPLDSPDWHFSGGTAMHGV